MCPRGNRWEGEELPICTEPVSGRNVQTISHDFHRESMRLSPVIIAICHIHCLLVLST